MIRIVAFSATFLAAASATLPTPAQAQRGNLVDCLSTGRLVVERFYTTTGNTGLHPRADYYVALRNPDSASGVFFNVTFDAPDLYRQATDEAHLLRPGQQQRLLLGSRIAPGTDPVPELSDSQIASRTRLLCR